MRLRGEFHLASRLGKKYPERRSEEALTLLERAIAHVARQASPHDAVLLQLARMACQREAARALTAGIAPVTGTSASLLGQLSALQDAAARAAIRARLSESPPDYGFASAAEIHAGDAPTLGAEWTSRLGAAVAAAGTPPEAPVGENHAMMRETFRKLADTHVMPIAESIHREDRLVPEDLITRLRELGCFGLSIPESYGGFQSESDPDTLGMVLVTEELSRGSLGAAGSLITRPEILARALLKGGTEGQKSHWLPRLAAGERMVGIAVTEPDHGSDVAGLRVTATPCGNGAGWLVSGTKTWCTFAGRADVLALLARTSPDGSLRHKGLSLLLVEKPAHEGHAFRFSQDGSYWRDGERHRHAYAQGAMEGRAIPTIGYRGMHSFEVKLERWFVPADALVGEKGGEGRGFYLQMEGFAAGRLQTAARANGLMHAALERAIGYANDRSVFGRRLAEHPAAAQKLAFMAAGLLASRALTYDAADRLERPEGTLLAAMAKLYASQTAEWLTREAQQLHGGMGYAEEFAVSRYFVDARVLSIFEGAEEVLAVKVIAPALLGKGKSA
jgi:(2S)-methylsuccinyl-CoA dehydrogenase